jgi:hypothetical protein
MHLPQLGRTSRSVLNTEISSTTPTKYSKETGKQVRYLTVSAWDPTLHEVLNGLIDQAIQLH